MEKMLPFMDVPKKVYIQVLNKQAYEEKKKLLYDMADEHSGNNEVIVVLKEEKQMKPWGRQFGITVDDETIAEFKRAFGEGKVIVKEGKVAF